MWFQLSMLILLSFCLVMCSVGVVERFLHLLFSLILIACAILVFSLVLISNLTFPSLRGLVLFPH